MRILLLEKYWLLIITMIMIVIVSISNSMAANVVKPYIHWAFDGDGKDKMGHQDIMSMSEAIFSEEGRRDGSKALSFDFSKQRIIDLSTGKQPDESDFTRQGYRHRTFSLWFRANKGKKSRNALQCLFNVGGEKNGVSLYVIKDEICALFRNDKDTETSYKRITSVFSHDQWNHVALRYESGEIALFLNGDKVANDTFASTEQMPVAKSRMTLGGGSKLSIENKKTKNNYALNGLIEDVRIFDIALSNKNVQRLFRGKKLLKGSQEENSQSGSEQDIVQHKASSKNLAESNLEVSNPLPASVFQPEPEKVDLSVDVEAVEKMALPESAKQSALVTRVIIITFICVLVFTSLSAARIMFRKSNQEV